MEKKLYDKKQQQILDAFFKEFFTCSAENVVNWFVAGIFIFVHGIFMVIPYQEIKGSELHFSSFLTIMGYMWYLMPYIRFTENRKIQNIYEKIKYMPISFTQFRIYRMKKFAFFCLRLLAIFMIGQLFFSLVFFHEITLANICYPLVWGFAFPFGINALLWWFVK